jgi:hypothetical protein
MDLLIIRNKSQLKFLTDLLSERRLPLRIAVDDIYPIRSLDMNAYYWGIVLKYISDESGHSVDECHDAYKRKFNLKIELEFNDLKGIYEPVFGVGSTAELDKQQFFDYIFRVRCDGEMEHHVVIPLPNECFIPELNFEHDKLKEKRL